MSEALEDWVKTDSKWEAQHLLFLTLVESPHWILSQYRRRSRGLCVRSLLLILSSSGEFSLSCFHFQRFGDIGSDHLLRCFNRGLLQWRQTFCVSCIFLFLWSGNINPTLGCWRLASSHVGALPHFIAPVEWSLRQSLLILVVFSCWSMR